MCFQLHTKHIYFPNSSLISCFVTVYGAPESSEMSKKPQKLKDSLIGMLHILPSFYFIYIPSNLWVIFTKHKYPWIIRTSSLNYDTSINFVEIKIVNPDDPNVKSLQKKLPGIYITEKVMTMLRSIPQRYCIYTLYLFCRNLSCLYGYWIFWRISYIFLNIYACILHVSGTMTVQKLKALIQRLYKADSEIKLSYVSKKASYLKYCAKWGDNFINK